MRNLYATRLKGNYKALLIFSGLLSFIVLATSMAHNVFTIDITHDWFMGEEGYLMVEYLHSYLNIASLILILPLPFIMGKNRESDGSIPTNTLILLATGILIVMIGAVCIILMSLLKTRSLGSVEVEMLIKTQLSDGLYLLNNTSFIALVVYFILVGKTRISLGMTFLFSLIRISRFYLLSKSVFSPEGISILDLVGLIVYLNIVVVTLFKKNKSLNIGKFMLPSAWAYLRKGIAFTVSILFLEYLFNYIQTSYPWESLVFAYNIINVMTSPVMATILLMFGICVCQYDVRDSEDNRIRCVDSS